MKTHFKLLTSALLILLSVYQSIAQEATKAHKDSLNTVITKYYDLNLKIFQINSTVEDIDKVFELFTDDFIYVHPKYGGRYTRTDLYNGYIRNQKKWGIQRKNNRYKNNKQSYWIECCSCGKKIHKKKR